MAKNNESKVTFKVFNQDFNKAMSEMETSAKQMRQELKLEQEQLKLTGSESEKLTSVLNSLQRQYEVARQKTQATAEQLEAVKRQFGENSAETARMETALRSAQIAEQQLANRIALTTNSLNEAREAESEATTESQKRRQALQQLQNEQNQLRSSNDRLNSEYELQKAQMRDTASEAEKMAAAQDHVRNKTELARQVVANLERQLALTEQEYGQNSIQANQMAARLNAARTSLANMDRELDNISSSSGDAADGMEELGRRVSLGNFLHASEILANMAEKVVELGKAATESASEMADSQQDIQSNLGVTEKQAEELQGVVKNVFEHGVTESIETASKAVQTVKMNMGDLNNADLEAVTNKVIAIGKHTDTDVNENVRAASQLMNHFGIDADESLDLIAAGFQNGLNKSDDFLDTLNEYAPQFSQAGFSANDMLNIIDSGMKSGAFNTDKAADAVKEFGLKLKDGTIKKNIKLFSDGTQDLFKKFENGKATSAQVFESISADIAKTKNQQEKYNLGVAAFGTQYEDLGDKAVDAFAKTGNAIDDVNGKADQMAKRSPGEEWQQSLRELKDTLAPIGTDLINALQPVVEMIGKLAAGFNKIPGPVRTVIEVLGGILALFTILIPVIAAMSIVFGAFSIEAGVLTVSIGALDIALWPLLIVIGAVIGVIIAVIAIIKNWGAIIGWLKGIWQSFVGWIMPIFSAIGSFFSIVWSGIVTVVSVTFTIIKSIILIAIGIILTIIAPIYNGFVTIFNAIITYLGKFWNLVKKGFSLFISFVQSTLNKIKSFFTVIWNFIYQNIISPVITKIKAIITTIISVISGILAKIKSLFQTAWNWIYGVAISPVINKVKSIINTIFSTASSIIGKVRSVFGTGFDWVKSHISSSIDYVKSKISGIWSTASSIVSKIKTGFGNIFKSIKVPHFSLGGWTMKDLPKLPKISISWHATGGVFTSPTILGNQGFGEAGLEGIVPLEGKYMFPIADAVANRLLSNLPQMAESKMSQTVTNIIHIESSDVVMDGKTVGKITWKTVQDEITKDDDRKARAKG